MSTERIMTLLEELCGLYGISGDEGDIRSYVLSHLDASCSAHTDNLGNISTGVDSKCKRSYHDLACHRNKHNVVHDQKLYYHWCSADHRQINAADCI